MIVSMSVLMPISMRMRLIMLMSPFLASAFCLLDFKVHVELDPFHTRLLFPRDMQMIPIHRQFLQFLFQFEKGSAQIDQCPDEHVAADPAENIEIERFHLDLRRWLFSGEVFEAGISGSLDCGIKALIWLAA